MTPSNAILGGVGLFFVLIGVAIAAYPGGTWNDRGAPGFDPVESFVCDLLAPVALDGHDNAVASRTTALAMMILTTAMGLAFWNLPAPRFRRLVRWCGLSSLPGLLLVPLTSPDHWLHAVAVFVGGVPAVIAGASSVVATWGNRRLFWWGAAMVVVFALEIAIYAEYLTHFGDPPLILPALERPAVLLLAIWLVAVALEMRRAE